jgi:hypothetical protein
MKKLLALLLLTSVVFAVTGCASGPAEEAAPKIDAAKDAKVDKGGAEASPTQD